MCSDFESYSRGKETIEYFYSYSIIPTNARKGISKLLQLCSKAETTANRITNPANYGSNFSAVQSFLDETVFELNGIRFELNGRFSVLLHS